LMPTLKPRKVLAVEREGIGSAKAPLHGAGGGGGGRVARAA
jgi:hypothetical protein